jgi:hypothetical protein
MEAANRRYSDTSGHLSNTIEFCGLTLRASTRFHQHESCLRSLQAASVASSATSPSNSSSRPRTRKRAALTSARARVCRQECGTSAGLANSAELKTLTHREHRRLGRPKFGGATARPLAGTHVCHVVSSTGLSGARPTRPLDGVIGPQDGKPRSPCRNGADGRDDRNYEANHLQNHWPHHVVGAHRRHGGDWIHGRQVRGGL